MCVCKMIQLFIIFCPCAAGNNYFFITAKFFNRFKFFACALFPTRGQTWYRRQQPPVACEWFLINLPFAVAVQKVLKNIAAFSGENFHTI